MGWWHDITSSIGNAAHTVTNDPMTILTGGLNVLPTVAGELTKNSEFQIGGTLGQDWQKFTSFLHGGKPPQTQAAGPAPTLANANVTAMGQQLSSERQMASSWDVLTGGQGVLDNAKTSGPSLLGS